MADIKFSEFPKANQSKDSDEIAILQDGVNKMIPSPVLESKIINKTVSRVIEQGGASLNVINLKGVVPTYADLALITPTPELNDAYQVEADGLVYVYTENGFQADGDGFKVQQNVNGVVVEGNTQAVSGGEVFNKFTDFFIIPENGNMLNTKFLEAGKFVNYSNGNIETSSPTSHIFEMPIEGDSIYTISNRTTSITFGRFRMAIVLYDAQGNKLKPLKLDGTEYLYYSTSEDDSDINGGVSTFKTPLEAVKIILTASYGSAPLPTDLMMTKGDVVLPYIPYSAGKLNDELKEDVINDAELIFNNLYVNKVNRDSTKIENRIINDNGDIIAGTSSYDVITAKVNPNSIIKVRYRSANTTGIAYYDANLIFKGFLDYGNNTVKYVELTTPEDCYFVRYVNLKTSTDTYIEHEVVFNEYTFFKDVDIDFNLDTQLVPANGTELLKIGVRTSNFIKVKKGDSVLFDIYQAVINATSVACFYDIEKLYVDTLTRNLSGIFTRQITQDGYVRFSTDMTLDYDFKIIRSIDLKEDAFDDSIDNIEDDLIEKTDLAFQFDEYYKRRKNISLENVSLIKSLGQEAKWYGYQYLENYNGSEYNTRIASSEEAMDLHATLPIQSKIRRCVTDRLTGEVKYYLDANDSLLKEDGSLAKLDGTDGNFMVEIPDFYYKCEREELTIEGVVYLLVKLKISEFCIDSDWIFSQKCYTSAIEAIADRELNNLCSVMTTNFTHSEQEVRIETDTKYVAVTSGGYSLGNQKTAIINSFTPNATRYRGGYNNSDFDNSVLEDDDFERNQLGRPIAYINRGELNKMIPNSNFTVHKYDTLLALTVLYIVEYATTDAQQPFGTDTSEGYKTGGTGWGATLYPNYNAFEYFWLPQGGGAVLPQGVTTILGNNTGEVYYKMTNVPIEYTGNASTPGEITQRGDVWMPVLSYRGVEHFYGHLYKIIEQININVYLDENNVKQADLYYQPNPYRLSDESVEGYQYLGKNSTTGNYVEKMTFTENNNRFSVLSKQAKTALGWGTSYGGDFAENLFHGATKEPKVYYTTYNGRIVSGRIVGLFFSCALYKAIGTQKRPSDTTRLDHY